MKSLKRGIKVLFINLFVFLLLYELISIVLIWGFSFEAPPPYHTNRVPRMVDSHPAFGTWHLPNQEFFMSFSCFAVMNYYNEYGARDKSRKKKCQDCNDRIIVLGDSFIEGVGVDTTDRATDIIERITGRECLNFGISATGTTQARLVYEHLAGQFHHSTIIFGHFPANDFDDDDYEQRLSESNRNRYRPYIKKDSSGFHLVYHVDELEKSSWYPENIRDPGIGNQLKQWLKNYTHMGRVTAVIVRSAGELVNKEGNQPRLKNKFNEFSEDDWSVLQYNLRELRAFAPHKRIIVMTIPSLADVLEYQQRKYNLLGKKLTDFCRQNNMEYIDLLSKFAMQDNVDNLYHSCDGHWSAEGNLLVARTILERL